MYILEVEKKEDRQTVVLQIINEFFHQKYTNIEQAYRHEEFSFIERSAKTKTTKISIEDITLFKQKLQYRSEQEKLAIINNADQLTPESQNSLLKILEEPPENLLIILIPADQRHLLATIRSRGVSLKMSEISQIHTGFKQEKFVKMGYNVNTNEHFNRIQEFLNWSLYDQLLFISKSLQAVKETPVGVDKEDILEEFLLDLLRYYEKLLETDCTQALVQKIFFIEECLKKVQKGVNARLMLEYIILKLQTNNG